MTRAKPFLTNENLTKLEAILDAACADLGIDPTSDYSRSSREFIARMLLNFDQAEGDAHQTTMRLTRRAASYGLNHRPHKAG